MKAIKIILGIFTVLVIGFFVTGIVIKETVYTTEITVNKPVEEVFELFNDTTRKKEWVTDLKSVEIMKETPAITGSIYKMTVDNRGNEVTMTEKVLAFVPNEKVTHFFDAENMLKTDEYIFIAEGEKTIIKKTSSCRSESYIMSCIFPYFKSTLKQIDQKYLNNFKELAEKK